MADDLRVIAKIEGLDEFVAKTRRVGDVKAQRRIMKAAFRGATNPTKTALRREIRSKAKRRGNLAKAVTSKVVDYRTGVVYAIVGVKRQKLPGGENPGNYFHLVDLGTQRHNPKRVRVFKFRDEQGNWRTVGLVHPGSQAKPMRRPAAINAGPKTTSAFEKAYTRALTREMKKKR